jgi:nucleotide-binding universal stress UspA family protein
MPAELPRQLLCPVDLSELSAEALRFAAVIAQGTGARLTALYAESLPMPPYFTEGQIEALRRQFAESFAEAERSLARFVQTALGQRAAGIELRVIEALPVEGILAAAGGLGADWIVMGTHGRSGVNRWMLGSVAERVLRASTIPVVTVRGGRPAPEAIRHLLCPVNDSTVARRSLELAVKLASSLKAELTVLHVQEEGGRDAIEDLCAWIPEENRSRCAIREVTRRGEAAREILEAAAEADCDLLVLGAQHRLFFDSTVIGTTTVRVVRHAPCPVLTVIEGAPGQAPLSAGRL